MKIISALQRWRVVLALAVAAAGLAVASARAADLDQDGIDDELERRLLTRFTPQLRFSIDSGVDPYRPMDARQYVQWSQLQNDGDKGKGVLLRSAELSRDPALLLSRETNVIQNTLIRGDRFLSPMDDVPQPGQWARHGFDWRDVTRARNVGLYGHVVPLRIAAPQRDFLFCRDRTPPDEVPRDDVLCTIDARGSIGEYYKVEYWQFFGYNGVGKPFDLGDHEGDWCTVQVIVDAKTLSLVQVHHYFHGRNAAYDLRKHARFEVVDNGTVREYRGPNWPQQASFTWHEGPVAVNQNRQTHRIAQNNVVRLARDPSSGEFSHPVVYVERGGHEFWPTDAWSFKDSPNHNGADVAHSYIAALPPNLGEVEHPLNETQDARVILQYNSRWGAYNRKNTPPQGPALHDNWTWPAGSSVRWRLPLVLGF